jgi:hypothetical protein
MYWGPGGPPAGRQVVDSWTRGRGYADTWGPYHQALFRPRKVTPWIRFKTMSSGANIAQRLWDEREALRLEYHAAHGDNPDEWRVRHPGVVLESVQWIAHAACLRCQWFQREGAYTKLENWRMVATEAALQHENSA